MGSRCIVVGGGAAGIMAAYSASYNFDEVILLEKNEKLGKKIYITGKGRCNVTNDCEPDTFFDNVVNNPKFLYSAYYGFDNKALIKLISDNGCPLKTERGDRVFPVSDHSSDIIKALHDALKKRKVSIRLNTAVKDIMVRPAFDGAARMQVPVGHSDFGSSDDAGEKLKAVGVVLKDGSKIECERVILATGGLSYPSTGSTGDGHGLLRRFGHTVNDCYPALVPFCTKETCVKDMQGLSLKNVAVKLFEESDDHQDDGDKKSSGKNKGNKKGNRLIYEGFGEMLFTHFGVSGPLILSASSYYGAKCPGKGAVLHIDLKPALTFEQLDKRILRDFEDTKNKAFRNSLNGLLPSGMIPVIIQRCGIDPDKQVNSVTKSEREILVNVLKDFTLTVTGTRDFNEAIVTGGGISVKEVNPSTMESKLIGNLYIAGELLDVDALTGGFNLQIAWSTGFLAGCI